MSWTDVCCKVIEFLEKPNALALVIIALVLGFLVFITPVSGMVYIGLDNTRRLETASKENTDRLEKAILKLAEEINHRNSIANR